MFYVVKHGYSLSVLFEFPTRGATWPRVRWIRCGPARRRWLIDYIYICSVWHQQPWRVSQTRARRCFGQIVPVFSWPRDLSPHSAAGTDNEPFLRPLHAASCCSRAGDIPSLSLKCRCHQLLDDLYYTYSNMYNTSSFLFLPSCSFFPLDNPLFVDNPTWRDFSVLL